MAPSDLALLVLLGIADRGPVSMDEVVAAAREVAPQDWQPTSETIGGALERALSAGLVLPSTAAERRGPAFGRAACGKTACNSAPEPGTTLETTPLGRRRIVDLLSKPIPDSPGGFVRTCMSAKLRCLHRLSEPERRHQAERLAEMYLEAIAVLRRVQQLPRPLAGPAIDSLCDELVALASELAWLESLARGLTHGEAAE